MGASGGSHCLGAPQRQAPSGVVAFGFVEPEYWGADAKLWVSGGDTRVLGRDGHPPITQGSGVITIR